MNTRLGRRQLLTNSGILGLGLLAGKVAKAAESCGLTPEQPEGPFYPVRDQSDKDTDLTRVKGHTQSAAGQVLHLEGQVVGPGCTPLAGAMVEIWQAAASGKYNHPEDPNLAPLDPHFQYWGRTVTDSQGRYHFKTVKPGAYPADTGWVRPPHIHFEVAAPGFPSLTTQMYFRGDPLNDKDRILRRLAPDLRQLIEVPFTSAGNNEQKGTFDIVVGPAGGPSQTPELD